MSSYSAKERLVLTHINYLKDRNVEFEDSHVLSKCHNLLISCYGYKYADDKKEADYGSFPMIDSFIYRISDEDYEILKNDYDIILSTSYTN